VRLLDRIRLLIPLRKPTGLRPTVPTAALPLFVLAIAFTFFGLGLVFQSSRFENTPSYGNLLLVAPAWLWGTIHLLSAALMFGSIRWRTMRGLAVSAHTVGIALVGSWLLAFVVRYLTDTGTTLVNVINWSVLLFLAVRSSVELDQWIEPRPPARDDK
jgi:surface polysaccharide O-acyltransferase-like enzyme